MSGPRCARAARSLTARGGRESVSCRADQFLHRFPSCHEQGASARGVQAAPMAALPVLPLSKSLPTELAWVEAKVLLWRAFPPPAWQRTTWVEASCAAVLVALERSSPAR